MIDWRKYDLVEHRKGRYRLERQGWSFWDWALLLIIFSLVWRFWWVALVLAGVALAALTFIVLAGALLSFLSRKK